MQDSCNQGAAGEVVGLGSRVAAQAGAGQQQPSDS